jgi:hypothetical protein
VSLLWRFVLAGGWWVLPGAVWGLACAAWGLVPVALARAGSFLRSLDTAVKPDDPHPYAAEASWPGSCWCGRGKEHPKHPRPGGAAPALKEDRR